MYTLDSMIKNSTRILLNFKFDNRKKINVITDFIIRMGRFHLVITDVNLCSKTQIDILQKHLQKQSTPINVLITQIAQPGDQFAFNICDFELVLSISMNSKNHVIFNIVRLEGKDISDPRVCVVSYSSMPPDTLIDDDNKLNEIIRKSDKILIMNNDQITPNFIRKIKNGINHAKLTGIIVSNEGEPIVENSNIFIHSIDIKTSFNKPIVIITNDGEINWRYFDLVLYIDIDKELIICDKIFNGQAFTKLVYKLEQDEFKLLLSDLPISVKSYIEEP